MMTVAELKAKLDKFPDDSPVLMHVEGEEYSIDEVREALWEIHIASSHE